MIPFSLKEKVYLCSRIMERNRLNRLKGVLAEKDMTNKRLTE